MNPQHSSPSPLVPSQFSLRRRHSTGEHPSSAVRRPVDQCRLLCSQSNTAAGPFPVCLSFRRRRTSAARSSAAVAIFHFFFDSCRLRRLVHSATFVLRRHLFICPNFLQQPVALKTSRRRRVCKCRRRCITPAPPFRPNHYLQHGPSPPTSKNSTSDDRLLSFLSPLLKPNPRSPS